MNKRTYLGAAAIVCLTILLASIALAKGETHDPANPAARQTGGLPGQSNTDGNLSGEPEVVIPQRYARLLG